MKKVLTKKKLLLLLLAAVLVAATVLGAVRPRTPEQTAQEAAQAVLTELFSCTREQAQQIEDALAVKTEDAQPGLTSAGQELETYAEQRYAALMTPECIEQQLANRTFTLGAGFAQKQDADMEVSGLELTSADEREEQFRFKVTLCTIPDQAEVAQISGTIRMEKTSDGWKASNVRASVVKQMMMKLD